MCAGLGAPRRQARGWRLEAWQRLGTHLDLAKLGVISREIGLSEVVPVATQLLNGEVKGRVVVDVAR